MNISPANVSIPAVVPSVNPPTEQVARDNLLREKIIPPRQLTESMAEKPANLAEKQRKKPSWDPAEHQDYGLPDTDNESPYSHAFPYSEYLLGGSFVSGDSFTSSHGYTMRFSLPESLTEKLQEMEKFEKTRAVVAVRYQQTAIPNRPSEILIVI
ncbi:ATP-dependent Lon protease [Veronia nyctiphanis]|uniref:ATP-dependent Lon protease n=1 Tax=Veronia nyctiphanis TaxID=1278244 RepID=A0A4Q0YPY7_9GAMM|nr:ATP-dependent Lon protease [Veronia nyctiphanis]RXJ73046.1 ATP-dependent Lon protease [Veronia nyctiphanis]